MRIRYVLMIFAVCFLGSCARQDYPISDQKLIMYDTMHRQCTETALLFETKASLFSDSDLAILSASKSLSSVNGTLSSSILNYIDSYTEFGHSYYLNEDAIIEAAAEDPLLSSEESVEIAKALGCGMYIKSWIVADTTKSPEDCLEEYRKACRRAIRDYIIAGALGGFTPGAVVAATAVVVVELIDAEEDYEDCMAMES